VGARAVGVRDHGLEERALGRVERLEAPRLGRDRLLLGAELLGPLRDDGFEPPLPARQRPLAGA